jgi:hypothetical protein
MAGARLAFGAARASWASTAANENSLIDGALRASPGTPPEIAPPASTSAIAGIAPGSAQPANSRSSVISERGMGDGARCLATVGFGFL